MAFVFIVLLSSHWGMFHGIARRAGVQDPCSNEEGDPKLPFNKEMAQTGDGEEAE